MLYGNLESYSGPILVLLVIVLIWSLVWKGIALWKAARQKQLPWFIAILIVNTVGILEILYIFVFSKIKFDEFDKGKRKSKNSKTNTRKIKSKRK